MTGPEFDPDHDGGYIETELSLLGHAGPYFPYDVDDPRAPIKEKRAPGFVTAEDYVTRSGVVKQYKRKRKR